MLIFLKGMNESLEDLSPYIPDSLNHFLPHNIYLDVIKTWWRDRSYKKERWPYDGKAECDKSSMVDLDR